MPEANTRMSKFQQFQEQAKALGYEIKVSPVQGSWTQWDCSIWSIVGKRQMRLFTGEDMTDAINQALEYAKQNQLTGESHA